MSARECRRKIFVILYAKSGDDVRHGSAGEKFSLTFFKRSRCQEAEPLVALRRVRNPLRFKKRRRGEKQSGGLFFVGNPRRGFPGQKQDKSKPPVCNENLRLIL